MEISKTIVGVDTAKRMFHLYWVDMETGEEMNLRLSRAKFLRHFANHVPCLVAMEACGGSQHWARELQALGHEVRILPAKAVRPFVKGQSYQDTSLRHSKTKVFLSRIRRRRRFLLLQSQRDRRRVKRIGGYHPRRALAGLTGGDNAAPD